MLISIHLLLKFRTLVSLLRRLRIHLSLSLALPVTHQLSPSHQIQQNVQNHYPSQSEKVKIVLRNIFGMVLKDIEQSQEGPISQKEHHSLHNLIFKLPLPQIQQRVHNQQNHHTMHILLLFIVPTQRNQYTSTQQTTIPQKLEPLPPNIDLLSFNALITNQLAKRKHNQNPQHHSRRKKIRYHHLRQISQNQHISCRTINQRKVNPFNETLKSRIHRLVLNSLIATLLETHEQESNEHNPHQYRTER